MARSKVYLIFLVRKSYKTSKQEPIVILDAFVAPHTSVYSKPWKYNELEYRIDKLKLLVEFFQVLKIFCKLGDSILLVFGGGKVFCAGLVSISTIFSYLIS